MRTRITSSPQNTTAAKRNINYIKDILIKHEYVVTYQGKVNCGYDVGQPELKADFYKDTLALAETNWWKNPNVYFYRLVPISGKKDMDKIIAKINLAKSK
jgi:hypothetical protein